MRPALGGCKTSRSLHLPARIFKVYIEALSGFGHTFSPDGFNSTLLSQGCLLEMASAMRMVDRMYISKTGIGQGASDCLGPAGRSTGSHIL